MSELKDPAIKLFGKTIQLSQLDHLNNSLHIKRTAKENEHEEDTSSINQPESLGIYDDPKTPSADIEIPSKKENNPDQEKPQKPDKILPCPRCNSMDTKFCYYNNYNVNQPRHFCKHCQRYWTAGGTMRNTPVGSGRRKNKALSSTNSASVYRQLIISEKNNGSVVNVNFGSDTSSSAASNLVVENDHGHGNYINGFWNNNSTPQMNYPSSSSSSSSWCYNPYYNSGFPANFYPYWVQLQQNPWQSPLMNCNSSSSSSPLGKHSRDGDLKDIKDSMINGGIISKAFQSKIEEKNDDEINAGSSTNLVNLQANPAALSRSLNFRETL